MPIEVAKRLAFPCLACIREEGHPDNDWFTELARIVLLGNVTSMEVWSLLRKRDGQNSHGLINKIVNVNESTESLDRKIKKIAEAIREYGVPRTEDNHTCGRKRCEAHTD